MDYAEIEGKDQCSHAVTDKNTDWDTDLQQCEPQCLAMETEFIDPNRVVHEQEDLAGSREEPANVREDSLTAENEQQQTHFQGKECHEGEYFGVNVLVHAASEQPHDYDAEVYDASQEAQLGFVHIVLCLQILGAGWEDAVIEVYEDVREHHQYEDNCRWPAFQGRRFPLLILHNIIKVEIRPQVVSIS